MNILINSNIDFSFAGFFQSKGEWIHPRKIEKTYEIIYVTEGEVYMNEGGKDICAKAGDLILLEPEAFHFGTKTTMDVSFYWVHFFVDKGTLPFDERFFSGFENSYLFKELLHYNNLPDIPEYLVNSLLLRILSELCYMSNKNGIGYDARAEKIYEWIRINVEAGLSVSDIAKHFGYSPDHISRICKKNYGVSAKELINRFLMAKARSMLANTDKYVKEVAAELGFTDDRAFVAYFKYHDGCFPSEFRNRFGKVHMNSR
ncbi:MAG: AraC family transcriptional regulator [Clostridia bacterium]|nr:AraC family transcriptional regulator [Clostridia bacterium]